MEEAGKVDFKVPKIGSKYSHIINEGTGQALAGMVYRNPYSEPVERAAFDYGHGSGMEHRRLLGL